MFSKQSEYLRSADLWDDKADGYRDVTVQIERVAQGTITGEKGRQDKMPFVYFANSKTGKPLGINATNGKTLCKLAGSQNAARWVGLWITLFVTQTADKQTGEMVDCIRIRPKLAQPHHRPKADAPLGDLDKEPNT